MAKKTIHIMNTAFRDGFQSVYGARVITKDFLPAVEACVAAGIRHLEAGGGARFQSAYFYCNEDAFAAMDAFRKAAGPDAELQTLSRGINVVGLESYSSDVIELHARLFKKHGITTIRNFDALNDVNNLIWSGQCIKKHGLKHEVVVSMMALPPGCEGAHTPDFYEMTLRKILEADIPYDSVCFKDASGTSTPQTVYETIRRAKKMLPENIKVVFHSHETAGCGVAAYKAAAEAGVDQLDCSMTPCSGGTCQPDIVTVWHALRGTDYVLDVDIEKVLEAEEVLKECMKDYFLPPEATQVDPMIVYAPMPGGALTANTQMMRDNHCLDRYREVIRAMVEVVRKGGFGTSVTPVSQFYFQQAFNNVMFGPWKKFAEGYGKMVLGYFGRTPVVPDPEIVKLASEHLKLEPTRESPLAINDRNPQKGLAHFTKMITDAGLPVTDENVFIAAACKEKGILFLKGEAKLNVRKNIPKTEAKPAAVADGGYTVSVNGKAYAVQLHGDQAVVNGKNYAVAVKEGIEAAASTAVSAVAPVNGVREAIKAPLPGLVVRVVRQAGDAVRNGETVLVLEAMKMEVEIKSHVDGTVAVVHVKKGDQIQPGMVLAELS